MILNELHAVPTVAIVGVNSEHPASVAIESNAKASVVRAFGRGLFVREHIDPLLISPRPS